MKSKQLIGVLAVLALVIAACTDDSESTLDAVVARDAVNCGVNDSVPGFGFLEADGSYSGFDIDFCKALAAAVLGDANKVNYVPLAPPQRFTALQGGEIDVLIRNTTRTAARDGAEAATFATTTFYDGQRMMVRAGEFDSIDEMTNTTICTLSGTTTEQNLATRMAGIPHTPSTFENNDQLREAFIGGSCDGWTSDNSQLAAQRSVYPADAGGPEALVILDEFFSKEPLGPAVLDGDSQWAQIVDWVVLATILAEEFGITSSNIDTFSGSDNPAIRKFLGIDEAGVGLGLDDDFASNIIRAVGNYGEIYDRNIGPLDLPRGVNDLWTNGGLLYAPPY